MFLPMAGGLELDKDLFKGLFQYKPFSDTAVLCHLEQKKPKVGHPFTSNNEILPVSQEYHKENHYPYITNKKYISHFDS